jgi:hypothetical protein
MPLKTVLRASPPSLFIVVGLFVLSIALLGSLRIGVVETGFRSVVERAVVGIVAILLIGSASSCRPAGRLPHGPSSTIRHSGARCWA